MHLMEIALAQGWRIILDTVVSAVIHFDRFGERFHADRYYVNMPSLQSADSPLSCEKAAWGYLLVKWRDLDAVVVSIGGSPDRNAEFISEFPRTYKKRIQSSGTVGDILSQYFYTDGRILDLDARYRLLAMDIRELRDIPDVIALAGGRQKCGAIVSAARQGFIKTLVTDYDTAEMILSQKESLK